MAKHVNNTWLLNSAKICSGSLIARICADPVIANREQEHFIKKLACVISYNFAVFKVSFFLKVFPSNMYSSMVFRLIWSSVFPSNIQVVCSSIKYIHKCFAIKLIFLQERHFEIFFICIIWGNSSLGVLQSNQFVFLGEVFSELFFN